MAGKHAKPKPSKRSTVALAVVVGGGVAVPVIVAPAASAATLGPASIAQAAKAGCPQLSAAQINTAVKIAMAESGGRTDINAYGPEDSRGLWQINAGVHGSPWGNLYDAVTNARAMCDISNGGTNWRPWSVYLNGSYASQPGYTGSVGTTPRPTPPAPVTPSPKPSVKGYTVKPGDTLWKVSPGHDWRSVWALNKATVKNPNVIYPGQVLRLR